MAAKRCLWYPTPSLSNLFDNFISPVSARQLVVLSFFDGVGTAPWLVQQLVGTPRMAFAWEIDRDCVAVSKARVPFVQHRGNILTDDYTALASLIDVEAGDETFYILVSSGAPCPDFPKFRTRRRDGLVRKAPSFALFVMSSSR